MMDIVKQGYVRIKSARFNLWKKRWIILRRASSKGPVRIEKYSDERSVRTCYPKTMYLNHVKVISRLGPNLKPHSLQIQFSSLPSSSASSSSSSSCSMSTSIFSSTPSVTTSDQMTITCSKWMACDSDLEADCWVKLLRQECLLPEPGLATGEPDILAPGIQRELQQQFHVYLMPNPKLDTFGECLLQVTPENIYLWDVTNPKLKLVSWPLTALRRYGSDPTKFTFEAGRHCVTGEGMFVFHTLVGEQIYRKVHQATLAIAEAHHRTKRQAGEMGVCTTSTGSTNSSGTSSPVPVPGSIDGVHESVTRRSESSPPPTPRSPFSLTSSPNGPNVFLFPTPSVATPKMSTTTKTSSYGKTMVDPSPSLPTNQFRDFSISDPVTV